MGLLSRLLAPTEPPPLDALLRRVRGLEELLESQTTTINRLRTEWAAEQAAMTDLQGKLTAWLGRLAARERKRAEKAMEALDGSGDESGAEPAGMSKAELRRKFYANGGSRR